MTIAPEPTADACAHEETVVQPGLSDIEIEEAAHGFARDGFLVLPKFYPAEEVVAPICAAIQRIIEIVAKKHGVKADCSTPQRAMTAGYIALIRANRAYGGEIYDAVKQIPSFTRLVAHPSNTQLFEALRKESVAGIAAGGYGIRIDNPSEEKFRAHWHQEFPAQLRSLDGVVFWSPLLAVTEELGPVQILPGSHKEGYLSVHEKLVAGKTGAYALSFDREADIIAKYEPVAPLTEPGDLIVMDFLTVHQSGYNISQRPRWSMQYRYFNYADPIGQELGWQGSFAAGRDFKEALHSLVGRI